MKYLNNNQYAEFDNMLNNLIIANEPKIGFNIDNSKRKNMNEEKFQKLQSLNN